MRPAEFAPEDIIAAGLDLVASGRSVTGFALRQKVGGGNPNRLKTVWDEHQASSVSKPVTQVALPVELLTLLASANESLLNMVNNMAVEMHRTAIEIAESRVAEAMRKASEMTEQAEKEMADAAQTVERLEEALEAEKGRVMKLTTELANEAEYAGRLEIELATLKERMAGAEKGNELVTKVDTLQAQMELLMQNMEPQPTIQPAPAKKKANKPANLPV
ncbi:MAG: DNA-binding protein [Betaproteobacteria bacterium]|nr:DNA-binding protein [Betaproteobacteria bacterium]